MDDFSQTSREIDLAVTGLLRGDVADLGDWTPHEIGIDDGVIVSVATPGTVRARRHVDVGQRYLLPGMVDAHVHSLSHAGEGLAAATSSAAAGGVTTVVEMPFDLAGAINTAERLARKQELVAAEAQVDVALLGTTAPEGGWREIESLRAGGAVGLKVSLFLTDPQRFPRISDDELINVFSAAAANEVPVCVHAENNEIIKALITQLQETGGDPLAHCRSRPPVSETLGVLTALEVASYTGVKLHVCHASLPRSVDLVRSYAQDGADVSLETCPHYLLLDEDDMAAQGGRLKINPPLRSANAREGLWDRLERGAIEVISSDHAPWPIEWKTKPNVFDNHSGAPGVETIYPLVLAEATKRGPAAFDAALRAMTINPAKRYNLRGKGALAVGYDADITVFDPYEPWQIDEATLHSNAGWSPYHGTGSKGRITMTMVRGRVVYDGDVVTNRGDGQLVATAS
jgi:allantoinase